MSVFIDKNHLFPYICKKQIDFFMKRIVAFISIVLMIFHVSAQNCDAAFSAANYSVAHTNKAYESYNSQQVREWTEKAIETFNEVEEITSECGCIQVSEIAYQGFEACDKAQEENTFERSRFFAKRAREKAKLMIEALSKCTSIPVSDIESRRNAGSEALGYAKKSNTDRVEDDLNSQQQELLAKQRQLIEQQRALEQQLADQAKQVAELKQQKANELIQQKRVKLNAEIALSEIQKSHERLATSLGCNEALQLTRISFTRTVDALERESLNDTKLFYQNKLNEIIEKFSQSFSNCAANW